MDATGVSSALNSFLEVQTCRAKLYTRFHESFNTFLNGRQEGHYKALMAELTQAFNQCSRQVLSLEATLNDLGRADLAAVLRGVQEAERDKLRLTLTLQALKQAAAFRTFSWQQGADGDHDDDDDEALALLDPLAAAARRHVCSHGTGMRAAPNHHHNHQQQQLNHQYSNIEKVESNTSTNPCASAAASAAARISSSTVHGEGSANGAAAAAAERQVAPDDGVVCSEVGCAGRPEAGGGFQGNGQELTGASAQASHGAGSGDQALLAVSGNGDVQGHQHIHGGMCGCGSGAGEARPAPEPTRREYEAAVKEAMQELDGCIHKINDAIGNIRMELEDD